MAHSYEVHVHGVMLIVNDLISVGCALRELEGVVWDWIAWDTVRLDARTMCRSGASWWRSAASRIGKRFPSTRASRRPGTSCVVGTSLGCRAFRRTPRAHGPGHVDHRSVRRGPLEMELGVVLAGSGACRIGGVASVVVLETRPCRHGAQEVALRRALRWQDRCTSGEPSAPDFFARKTGKRDSPWHRRDVFGLQHGRPARGA